MQAGIEPLHDQLRVRLPLAIETARCRRLADESDRPASIASLGSLSTATGFVDAFRRRWKLRELLRWSSRARRKFTAAIRAAASEDAIRTGTAERAFKRTDDRVR